MSPDTGDKLRKSQEIKELAAALAKAQGSFGTATKDALNPHFKQNYANLASVREASYKALSDNGLALTQFPHWVSEELGSGDWQLTTLLAHSSGDFIEVNCPLFLAKQDSQGFAAAMTYARRISWQSICGIVSDDPEEDDDGESNVTHNALGQQTSPPRPTRAAMEAQDNADRAEAWARTEVAKIIAAPSVEVLASWEQRNAKTLASARNFSVHAGVWIAAALSEARERLKPVPQDLPRAPEDDEADETAAWFQKRLDDLGACEKVEDIEELNVVVTERLGGDDSASNALYERWVKALTTRQKALRTKKVRATNEGPTRL